MDSHYSSCANDDLIGGFFLPLHHKPHHFSVLVVIHPSIPGASSNHTGTRGCFSSQVNIVTGAREKQSVDSNLGSCRLRHRSRESDVQDAVDHVRFDVLILKGEIS